MYFTNFGLRARPFRTSPDVESWYPSSTHESALAELRRGIDDDEAILLLQGESGTGKSIAAHRLLEELPERFRTVFLTHGSFPDRTCLLQAILFDLGLPYQEMGDQELRLALTESCLDHFRTNGRTILIVDEAHSLPARLLEELRLLSNLEGKDGRAVQVVLLGLPGIADVVEQAGLESLRQRLTVCCRLEPFGDEEAADYLMHQIRRVGGRPEKILGEDVLDILTHASRGIPRLLNQTAHLAFTLAAEAESSIVDAEAAVEAINRLGLDTGSEEVANLPMGNDTFPVKPQAPDEEGPTTTIQMAREDLPPMYIYNGPHSGVVRSIEPTRPVPTSKVG